VQRGRCGVQEALYGGGEMPERSLAPIHDEIILPAGLLEQARLVAVNPQACRAIY